MTSPAIQLARECFGDVAAATTNTIMVIPQELERFYARAQAQALRDAADEFDGHREADGRSIQFASALRRMAEELRSKT